MDDPLGKNPLEDELDSIWKIPKGKPSTLPETKAGIQLEKESGDAWEPLEEALAVEDDAPPSGDALSMDVIANMATAEQKESDESYSEETIQLVGFILEKELFGIDIMKVQEIIRLQEVTRVPRTENFVKGVVNLRGRVIPVVSLRERFMFGPPSETTDMERIVIITMEAGVIGIEVDAVTEVFRIQRKVIIPPPPTFTRLNTEYIEGIGRLDDRILVILNFDKLFQKEKDKQDD